MRDMKGREWKSREEAIIGMWMGVWEEMEREKKKEEWEERVRGWNECVEEWERREKEKV